MKSLITVGVLIYSVSSLCQVFNPIGLEELARYSQRAQSDYRSSQIVTDFVSDVEAKYGVSCSESAKVKFSTLSSRTSYKTYCDGESRLKIKIVSNTIDMGEDPFQFEVIKEVIKRK